MQIKGLICEEVPQGNGGEKPADDEKRDRCAESAEVGKKLRDEGKRCDVKYGLEKIEGDADGTRNGTEIEEDLLFRQVNVVPTRPMMRIPQVQRNKWKLMT